MSAKAIRTGVLLAVCCVVLAAGHAFGQKDGKQTFVGKHPVEVTGMPICSQCHPDRWGEQDHTATWDAGHKFSAARDAGVCRACHREVFCAECHANKEEIKPSDKHKDRPWRESPHRGDYLTRHQIDARINPAPCFRCHGRQNNAMCRRCHR